MNQSEKVFNMVFVPYNQASGVLKPSKPDCIAYSGRYVYFYFKYFQLVTTQFVFIYNIKSLQLWSTTLKGYILLEMASNPKSS